MASFRPASELVTVTYEDGNSESITVAEHIADVWGIVEQTGLEEGKPDTLRTMQALCTHILCEQPIPLPLRDWFLDGIEKHKQHEGAITLDEIFGYRGKENNRNVYTSANSVITNLIHDMEVILWVVKMSYASASRLVVWRSQASVDPTSVARKFREKNPNYWAQHCLEPTHNWQEFDLAICHKYLDRVEQLGLAGVEKDIPILEKHCAKAQSMSADEYYQFITASKKPD